MTARSRCIVPARPAAFPQRGITTLVIAVLLLVILSLVVLFATSVGVFEQRTATNENRAKLVQSLAESSVNLAAEFMKANTRWIVSERTNGWLNAGSLRWQPCTQAASGTGFDPCLAEPDSARRALMYRYVAGGSMDLPLAATVPAAADLSTVSLGDADTNATVTVRAALCRIDDIDPDNPVCSLNPEEPGTMAITLVANAEIPGEGAVAQAKETIATFRLIGGAANVPLVASGTVSGLGNAQLVANPNAGGFGVPASIWSPCPIDIEAGSTGSSDPLCPAAGGGIGSVITCHRGEFLRGLPTEDLLTACPGTNACGCPSLNAGALSGHSGGSTRESIDILDIDGGEGALPDIQYFPREPWDDPNDPFDDSIFEVVFAQDVVPEGQTSVAQNCGDSGNQDCAVVALRNLGAREINCAQLGPSSSGLLWDRSGVCSLPAVVGSPDFPVVLVVDSNMRLNGNTVFYGMLYVRSSTNSAVLDGAGGVEIYGMAIVDGEVDLQGGFTVVYSEEIARAIIESPAFTSFGKVPGSWLDARNAF